ncbi:hypothetical protein QJS04_geneDACA003449 [Acorus gramineus]|uniref:V-type proton ATPase subunit S1/VOA1 transmembrane domain-containing protein n=1 Tax=Acorus gramineus TaxID=55184 RepID=A0AAV9BMS7_ACOGR|nr:hypothetical protein QJS04_geneDACA003449 [Acorus gramineus]
MEGFRGVLLALLISTTLFTHGSSSPATVPAFLWSPRHLGSAFPGAKEIVNYRTISPEDLAKSVMLEGGWSNILCSGKNLQNSVDYAVVFVGKKLQSSDITRNERVDPTLVDFLKNSFTKSNSSMAYPYITVSDEKETTENYMISAFTENCGVLGVSDIAFQESCSISGEDLTKLAGLNSIHVIFSTFASVCHLFPRVKKFKCDEVIVYYLDLILTGSAGEILSELVRILEHSGASYTFLYVSNPFRPLHHSSHHAMDRFLVESVPGNASATYTLCDGVCRIKSSLLEGIFVGLVLLIILLSGLCCMMGIDTSTRFENAPDS